MTNEIAVGFNGSVSSSEAAMWAAAEASARDTSLRIITRYEIPVTGEPGGPFVIAEVMDSLVQQSTDAAEAMAGAITGKYPELKVILDVTMGAARTGLTRDLDPGSLLVVGSTSHDGLFGFFLGSTARWAARHSPCPVVIVRGAATRGRPDRIVVGVDGSAAAENALEWAADEADLHQVELVVVHSWLYPYLGTDANSSQGRDVSEVDAACVLEAGVASARERCAASVSGVLVEMSPTSGLLETVRDGDLLVLGSRGRGAIASGLLGSTVNSVVEHAAVPVVVVRSADDTV
jgi:nucleotide-binding universal stress UspA family protein